MNNSERRWQTLDTGGNKRKVGKNRDDVELTITERHGRDKRKV